MVPGVVLRPARMFAGTLTFVILAQNTAAQKATAPPAPRVTAAALVRGVVFDSLTMRPVANATVWLPGGTQTTNTDEGGRFELDNIPKGIQFLAFSSPALDSLGLGTLGTQVDVNGDGLPVRLTTPSFQAVWKTLCTNGKVASATDSGIVWGTVRDASTDTRLSGASAGFSWYEMRLGPNKRYSFHELAFDTRTDSTGNYYACGLPSDIKISSEATGAKSASGTVEYVIGSRRLYRSDLLVSTDMVLQQAIVGATTADTLAAMRARGTSTLRGAVRDDQGKRVSNAIVTMASIDTGARSNDAGDFSLGGLPAGSQALQIRALGFEPITRVVELRPGQTTNLAVELPSAQTLATVNVRAERAAGVDKIAFEKRRQTGVGYFQTEKDFEGNTSILGMVLGMPRVALTHSDGVSAIGIRSRRQGLCVANTYLDGSQVTAEQIINYGANNFVAVELYNSEFNVPMPYDSKGCGVVLFWSRNNPRW